MSLVLNMKMNSSIECVPLCFELSKTQLQPSARQALFIKKIVGTNINSYQIISEIESYATKLGYPILQ
jgi:hypothetical protein